MDPSNAIAGGEVAAGIGVGGRVQQRCRFNESDDILLMKQVNASSPYRAGYGRVMAAWSDIAAVLVLQAKNNVTNFRPIHVDGKAVQSRFFKLIKSIDSSIHYQRGNPAHRRRSPSSLLQLRSRQGPTLCGSMMHLNERKSCEGETTCLGMIVDDTTLPMPRTLVL